ncbi:10806_t:CDS:2 [Gigaspora margarita]|uniref:10806_t:CDS:1 n=1 Tax=Gigaspora margarita TaxID=4874 RepID=A0ABN7UN60_GIGMA|nr:10806_t:CDS:2 [Gigaspora margarita]
MVNPFNQHRLLNAHQSVNEDLFKSAESKNSNVGNENSGVVTDFTTEDSRVDKRTRVEDEKDDCTEYDYERVNEYNKECKDVSDKYKGGIVYDSNSSECSYGSSNKGKEKMIQPVVHNTRKRSELSKIVNSNEKV